jgi:hypothetical protein
MHASKNVENPTTNAIVLTVSNIPGRHTPNSGNGLERCNKCPFRCSTRRPAEGRHPDSPHLPISRALSPWDPRGPARRADLEIYSLRVLASLPALSLDFPMSPLARDQMAHRTAHDRGYSPGGPQSRATQAHRQSAPPHSNQATCFQTADTPSWR